MAQFFTFLFEYNSQIIEFLLLLTFMLVMIWGFRIAFSKPVDAAVATPALADLEERITKALSKVSTLSSDNPVASADIEKLKAQLEEKSAIVTKLQKEVEASAANVTQDMTAKIKELEAKLAEYEIIAEDIADLSRYKDQNALLLKEIETLKNQGATKPAAPAAAAAAPAPNAAPVAPPAPAPAPPPPQTPVAEPTPAPVAAAPAPAEPAPVPVENSQEADKLGDSLLNDFQTISGVEKSEGAVDLSKMQSEAEKLEDVTGSVEPISMEEGINNDKLLSEAQGLNTDSEPVEDAKLLNQFENFVKKNEA